MSMSRSSAGVANCRRAPVRDRRHLLILGGTGEARRLAAQSATQFADDLHITTSLAGRTNETAVLAGEVRRGGFGGVEGLTRYLRDAPIDFVIDATHPFATRISAAARDACRSLDLPLLHLTRVAWQPRAGDHWIEVANAAEAATALPTLGHRVFLTIGHGDLDAFSAVAGTYFLVRLVEPPAGALPFSSYELILGRGPFTFDAERRIMESHAIDVLVAKASGGPATAAKLDAARALGIPVLMLRRPPGETGESVERVEDAVAWVAERLAKAKEVLS
jgi:precorrin-6A/cobalt-precorrin-6A reductase